MNVLGTESCPQHVAIVGSGPSGFYSAEALIRSGLKLKINLLERLPSPFGLVRSGVAPDHPKLKQSIQVFEKIASSPQFNFIGNVNVGKHISIEELKQHHHIVIFTCGAETDRKLGIPGEDLPGSHTATEFIGWYNSHPDYRERVFDLSNETAVIIGQGNVTADVARILSKSVDELKQTDIAEHALDCLAQSKLRNIYVIGRRGPAQAKFTSKELKEFGQLKLCDPFIDPEELQLNNASELELAEKTNVGNKKVYEILQGYAAQTTHDKQRCCHFTFLKGPTSIIGSNKVEKVILEKNKLCGEAFSQWAEGTGSNIELETGLLFRSIGYRGIPIPGVPFDEKKGVFPSIDGRIIDSEKQTIPQLYAAGWIKRGPSGIIGTNRADAIATVSSIVEDLEHIQLDEEKKGAEGIYKALEERKVRSISFSDWKKIDQCEIERGQAKQKPREKFTSIKEMLAILD